MMLAVAFLLAAGLAAGTRVDVCPQAFDAGGWGLDVQFMDVMGSPYLIAHGRGIRVTDAVARADIPEAGTWRVWVRTRQWVEGAGRFKVAVNGTELDRTFGIGATEWGWTDGGEIELERGPATVALVDLDGFDGRCAGVTLVRGDEKPVSALSPAELPVAETVDADFVVVGGGLPGTCAAVAAARRGLRVALVHDRPVLGGNAASEIRVWSAGEARYPLVKELRGWFMNRDANLKLSDANRMRIVANERTLTPYLQTRAFAVEKTGEAIAAVCALDWKNNRVIRFRAPLFCDTTGDGWVGFWAGADWRMGREARDEYGEKSAPEKADGDTLGASVMWTSAEANADVPFSAPWAEEWARGVKAVNGEWNWEYGIHHDQIADAEWIRDRLMLAIYGAFSLAKREPGNARRVIDFMPYLLGKRESRRLLGDWVFTENDIAGKRPFEDAIASGSWSMDLHFSGKQGIDFLSWNTHPNFGRYYIPYRSIYSRNVPNLLMAGRCFSCSHNGLGSPRVMNTLAQLGVAAGEAAALCRRSGCRPRDLWTGGRVRELQRILGGDFPGSPDPARANWRIVDDESETTSFRGEWTRAYCENGEQVGDFRHGPGKTAEAAVYRLPVEKGGRYVLYGKVPYLWNVAHPSETVLTLACGDTVETIRWDQTVRMGEWAELGAFELRPGATLTLDARASRGTVIADGFAIVAKE